MDFNKGGLKLNCGNWKENSAQIAGIHHVPWQIEKGNLLTYNKAIEERALEVLEDRLKPNKKTDNLKEFDAKHNEQSMWTKNEVA